MDSLKIKTSNGYAVQRGTPQGDISTITSDHLRIHAGEGFSLSGIYPAVANGATVNYAFKTPTVASGKLVHYKFREMLATANKIRIDLSEGPTNAPTNGTDLTVVNRNRTSGTVSAMQAVKTGMTLDLTGVTVLESAQFTGGNMRSLDVELLLKPDTWYIVTMTNSTGAASDISFFEFWYEEQS